MGLQRWPRTNRLFANPCYSFQCVLQFFGLTFLIFKRKLFSPPPPPPPLPLPPEPQEGLFVDCRISGYKGDHLSFPTGEESQSPPLIGLPLSGHPLLSRH